MFSESHDETNTDNFHSAVSYKKKLRDRTRFDAISLSKFRSALEINSIAKTQGKLKPERINLQLECWLLFPI